MVEEVRLRYRTGVGFIQSLNCSLATQYTREHPSRSQQSVPESTEETPRIEGVIREEQERLGLGFVQGVEVPIEEV